MVKLGRGFREFPPNSINGICALEETFMKLWGDTKYYLYYITKFQELKRKPNESVENFTKIFKKMYGNIPTKIKANDISTKLTFSNAFYAYFSLLLRDIRDTTLVNMQEVALEIKSNLLAIYKLSVKPQYQEGDKKKNKELGPSTSSSNPPDNKIDEMTKVIKNLSSKLARLEMENKPHNRPAEEDAKS